MATENQTADIQARRNEQAIADKINQKIESYPSAWKEIYKEVQTDEEFALLGKIMDAPTLRRYGFGINAQLPNLLRTYVNNQANETLQTKYHPIITPNGGGSDITKARMREDVLRGIFRNGGPQTFNAARRCQVAGGLHYSRVVVDYAADRGFQKEFRYEDCPDTFSIFPNPNVQSGTVTFADMMDLLQREDVPKDVWKERMGTDWAWGAEKKHTVWYYWEKKNVSTEKEYLTQGGEEVMDSELNGDYSSLVMMQDGVTPYSRDVSMFEWEWHVFDPRSRSVIRSGDWKGCYPPLIACTGEKVVENTGNGLKFHFFSMIRDAKEPATMYAVLEGIIKLRLGRSPHSKWKIPFESIVLKQAKEYRESSVTGEFDVLYRAFTEDGKAIPAPEEIQPYILDKILVDLQQVQYAKIERILGIFDDSLGRQAKGKSGVAVKELAAQSSLSQYHLEFNFMEYVKQCGLVSLEAFPKYLTAPQQIAFVDKDDKAVMQMINTPEGVAFDPNERYSMVVEASPDGDTDREAEAKGLAALLENPFLAPEIQKIPGAMALVIKAQRGRYAQQLGEMMDQASNDPEKAQMGQQLQQAQQVIRQLKLDLVNKNMELKGKTDQASLDAAKENNRHLEAISRLRLDAEVEPFQANTERIKVVTVPQVTEELPVETL